MWVHTVLWLAYTLLCRDIELACDEKVIRHLGRGERADYSQALLDCSRVRHRISACPVAFGETDVKARVKAVLNYKKPAFWIVLSALLCCVVLIVCFVTNPKQEQDLSFLNYKNAIPLLGMDDTAPYAVWYPEETSSIQPGVADSKALARYLEEVSWTRRWAPRQKLASPGSIEFIIEDGYRITVYRSARIAVVQSQDAVRYYRTAAGDYEAALAVFIPAPSTEPEIDGREAEAIGIYDRSYWAEVERVLAPFASPASMEIYLSDRFDADLPADSVFGDLTLRDYIYGTDDWKFEYNGPRLANDPEAAIIVRDFDGRTLWIMSDADALMIEESDGSITWASWGDAVDCADMIRHLLHWAQGRDPSEKEAAAERAAAAQRILADLGHYTLSGREPLREEAGTTLPFWAKMSDSRISAGGAWAIAYFGTEEMSADLRYDRLYWNGDPSQPLGAESFSMCRRTYAASGEVKDVRIGGHDAFLTDVSGFAGRRLIWYDQESDLLFSLVASHVSSGQIAGTFSEAELIAMAESVTPAKQSKG